MSAGECSAADAAERLCEVLEQVAAAMVTLDNEALLVAEVKLAELVGGFRADRTGVPPDPAVVAALVKRGRNALMRCRRLGASYTALTRARLAMVSTADTYNRVGAVTVPAGSVSSTVRAAI
jgi:hypothetical protein